MLPLPPWPTDALPGTVYKADVMEWRYANGFHIHHPLDARWNGQAVSRLKGILRVCDESPGE